MARRCRRQRAPICSSSPAAAGRRRSRSRALGEGTALRPAGDLLRLLAGLRAAARPAASADLARRATRSASSRRSPRPGRLRRGRAAARRERGRLMAEAARGERAGGHARAARQAAADQVAGLAAGAGLCDRERLNSPNQIVLSGREEALASRRRGEPASAASGAKRARPSPAPSTRRRWRRPRRRSSAALERTRLPSEPARARDSAVGPRPAVRRRSARELAAALLEPGPLASRSLAALRRAGLARFVETGPGKVALRPRQPHRHGPPRSLTADAAGGRGA